MGCVFCKKKIGILENDTTLIVVTLFKSIVGLFLGLVIQLSQVQPCAATDSKQACPTAVAQVHSCCEGKTSCPCANNSEQAPRPVPAIPVSVDLKLHAPKGRELDFLTLFFLPISPVAVPATASFTESSSGFAGVPLSVAFCNFVI